MNHLVKFLFFGWLGLPLLAGAQAFQLDPAVPTQPLNEKTELTVLNARLGSRTSASLVAAEQGLHTGTLGMDNDVHRPLCLGVLVGGQLHQLRTSPALPGGSFFPQQQLGLGLTAMQLQGTLPRQLQLTATLVSPFSPTDSLGDTAGIKTCTAPLYHWVLTLRNLGRKPLRASLRMGLAAIPWDVDKEVAMSWWRRGSAMPQLLFRDVAGPQAFTALAAQGGRHWDQAGYNGLELTLDLAPGATATRTFIYAGHNPHAVLQDLRHREGLQFYYNAFFKNIDEVIAYGWKHQQAHLAASQAFERVLSESKTSPEEKWVTALAFHTDLANSLLVRGADGLPQFYITEGRFRHMNTIDVAHETEIMAVFAPWRLKLQLEQWTNYLATKEVEVPSTRWKGVARNSLEGVSATELGPFLFHDVGNFPQVMPAEGYDFGPIMPVEENATFTLLLHWYWKLTGDDAFVRRHLGLVAVLLQSMMNRDSDGNGLADYGMGWSTYDVSEAIKRSPDNVYLGVKQLAAYVVGAEMLSALPVVATLPKNATLHSADEDGTTLDGNGKAIFERSLIDNRYLRKRQSEECLAQAQAIVSTLQQASRELGYLPASLHRSFQGWDQHSVVLAEGLFLPGLAGVQHPLLKEAATLLQAHHARALPLCTTPYGIKLSSGEDATWFSKIMVADVVAQYWWGSSASHAHYTYAWNRNNHQAYQDGAFSLTKPWPGNWYPRGISSLGYQLRAWGFTAPRRQAYISSLRP